MKKRIAFAACLIPFALVSIAQSQGPSGRSGSGAAGVEAQSRSTTPSGLAGSTGVKPDNTAKTDSTTSVNSTPSTGTAPTATDGSDKADASNRSASGDSTRHSSQPKAMAPGDTGKPSKSQRPNSPR